MRSRPFRAATALLASAVAVARAGGPPPPTKPPEYLAQVHVAPSRHTLEARGRVQHARPESLDLVRWLPRAGALPRLEAWFSAEGIVLHPLANDPERFRGLVERGAPLQWRYDLELARDADLPQAGNDDAWCGWLGGVLLAPEIPEIPDSLAVATIRLRARSALGGPAYGPWPERSGLFRPADLEDLCDAFLAVGVWRVRTTVVAQACTLQVAFTGTLASPDSVWVEQCIPALAPHLPAGRRALVCVVPTDGALAVFGARRSWLVRWPAARSTWPAESVFPGRPVFTATRAYGLRHPRGADSGP